MRLICKEYYKYKCEGRENKFLNYFTIYIDNQKL